MNTIHPVLKELLNRRDLPNHREGLLALSIEGGGMRGVISAGMVAALEHYGIRPNHFDAIYGSSAGAINGAYYIAGQARFGTSIYYEDITSKSFISFARALLPEPILNLKYLFSYVITSNKPLDIDRVVKSGLLRVMGTNLLLGTADALGPADSSEELKIMLRASATVPVIAGGPVAVGTTPYLDAALSEAIPWETPAREGFDHILVLSTRPMGVGKRTGLLRRLFDMLWSTKYPEPIRKLVRNRGRTSRIRAAQLAEATLSPNSQPFIYAICPDIQGQHIGQLEQDSAILIEGAKCGYGAISQALGAPLPTKFKTRRWFEEL